ESKAADCAPAAIGNGPVAILGAGAVGSYVGARLAAAGIDVLLLDGWPEHVEAIRRDGLTIAAPEGEQVVRCQCAHLGEAFRLRDAPVAAAILAVKLYDTEWAANLLRTWLPPATPVVTMQNALIEELVARTVGWARTLGAIASGMDVALVAPARVKRSRALRSTAGPVFRVGELHGRRSARAGAIAELLDRVDRAEVTTDLWNLRWAKLCANTMSTGLSGLTGLSLREVYTRDDTRAIAVTLAAEALALGQVLGFEPPALFGLAPQSWLQAAAGDAAANARARDALAAHAATMSDGGPSGTLQDLQRGRPTEVDFFNGYIAREAERAGTAAPTHARIAALIRDVERGRRAIGPAALAEIRGALAPG
ncbi:MAG TPA: 2-dehydropantoate 2-reductase, partial [Burkholderiaceae bacterium]|nr:2-dehydropantoate 2-reductase [Burkholderiaceae bacterium]